MCMCMPRRRAGRSPLRRRSRPRGRKTAHRRRCHCRRRAKRPSRLGPARLAGHALAHALLAPADALAQHAPRPWPARAAAGAPHPPTAPPPPRSSRSCRAAAATGGVAVAPAASPPSALLRELIVIVAAVRGDHLLEHADRGATPGEQAAQHRRVAEIKHRAGPEASVSAARQQRCAQVDDPLGEGVGARASCCPRRRRLC